MNVSEKRTQLLELYHRFESDVRSFRELAVCRLGCADCCTNVGDVDSTTLEGFFILERIKSLPASEQKQIGKRLKQNRRERESSKFARCGFLKEDRTCAVYDLRPFSCRRLYSVKVCGESGPTVHRQVWDLAGEVELSIQSLDDTGYSGHLSYILQLLADARFRNTYLEGGFSPDEISEYALKHNIIVNRYMDHLRKK